jgi:hypothetical protein
LVRLNVCEADQIPKLGPCDLLSELAQVSFQPVRFDILRDESKKEYSDQRDVKEAPMPMGRYRITDPIIAIIEEGGRHVAYTVPRGAIVIIEKSSTFDANRLVEVLWDEKRVMIFAKDLGSRSEWAE